MDELLGRSGDALDTDNEDMDPTLDRDASMKKDSEFLAERFCEDRVLQLDNDDKVSLGLFLCLQLSKNVGCEETKAAELAGMVGRSKQNSLALEGTFLC